MVGSVSHSSRVVTGERLQIMTVFPSAADTTLSSSATTAPRISTSSSNVVEGDVRRVIRRDQAPSLNKVLAGSGVGRGTAMKPVRQSTGRGQGLVAMLADSARRVGRGRSRPLATCREVRTGRKTDRCWYRNRTFPSSHDAFGSSGPGRYLLRGRLQATSED